MSRRDWPKLSETLTGPKSPVQCQNCSCGSDDLLLPWMECDHLDRPTDVTVMLCRPCSDALIEPHPRLYECLPTFAPRPGAMRCCADCALRVGTTCVSPMLLANGGEGLPISAYRRKQVMFIDGETNGKRWGYQVQEYGQAPECKGKQTEIKALEHGQ